MLTKHTLTIVVCIACIAKGLSHFYENRVTNGNTHVILVRFDCDLSQDLHDPDMKRTVIRHDLDVYFAQGLNEEQKERIARETEAVRGGK